MKPPKHLKAAGLNLWKRVSTDFVIDDGAGQTLLETACTMLQRADDARQLIQAEGLVLKDRFGQAKPHPAVAVERDARSLLISSLRALKLDLEDVA